MEIVSRKYKTIEEIEVDEVLYKYRNFENENHIRILSDLEIFFAPPTSFEDKLDCKIPIRYDLMTNQQIFEKYLSESFERNPKFTRRQHRDWARSWTHKSPLKNKSRLAKFRDDEFAEYDKRIGILSLTANNSSLEMWEKYSNNQSGFCVGFDTKKLFMYLGGGGPLNYVDELPTIKPRPWHSFDQQRYLREFSKLRCWEFEDEYRTMIFKKDCLNVNTRKRKLKGDVYKEVIIGDKISEENKQKIENIVSETLPHVKIRQQKIKEDKIMVE